MKNIIVALALIGGLGSYLFSPSIGIVVVAFGVLLSVMQYLKFIRSNKIAYTVIWVGMFFYFGFLKGICIYIAVELAVFILGLFDNNSSTLGRAKGKKNIGYAYTQNPVTDLKYHDSNMKDIHYPHL